MSKQASPYGAASGSSWSSTGDNVVFFFNQAEFPNSSKKRPKKILDERTLLSLSPKKLSNMPNATSKLSHDFLLDPSASLADRLVDLLKTTASVASLSGARTKAASADGTWSFYTDSRLQALKYLTDEMIKELDEMIVHLTTKPSNEEEVDEENLLAPAHHQPVQVNLPAQVICDWHADWSDLTEKCDLSKFPMWQTHNGKDAGIKNTVYTKLYYLNEI